MAEFVGGEIKYIKLGEPVGISIPYYDDKVNYKMRECCNTCKLKKKLVKFDYSQGGCIHTDYDGYACLAFAFEDEVVHMVGVDPDVEMCEMYSPKQEDGDVTI